jgi:TonB family protein
MARPDIQFRVEVQVIIDRTGKVIKADVLPGNRKVSAAVASAALAAAKSWTFEPARLRGQPIESAHTIVFDFR